MSEVSSLIVKLQQLSKLQSKSLPTGRTQNEEIEISEIRLEMPQIGKRNSPNSYCSSCSFAEDERHSDKLHNLKHPLYFLYIYTKPLDVAVEENQIKFFLNSLSRVSKLVSYFNNVSFLSAVVLLALCVHVTAFYERFSNVYCLE